MLSLIGYAAFILSLCSFGPGFRLQFWEVCGGFAYFMALSIIFHGLRKLVQSGQVGKISVLLASAIAFQLVPALLFRGPGAATTHVIGWELMLAAFSYVVDAARPGEEPQLADGLFFLLINPVLVFAERGHRLDTARVDRRALTYLALGMGGLIAQASLHIFVSGGLFGAPKSPLEISRVVTCARWVALCLIQFLIIYAGLAGLGNLQVGLMRCAGYHVPDRFVWPLFARSPGEFWERWNAYVAHWFTRYVFIPIARTRTTWFRSISFRYTIATLVTFTAVGLAHEYALLLQYGRARGAPTSVFVVAALIVIFWKSARNWLRARLVRSSGRHPRDSILIRSLAHLVFATLLLVMTWLAIPALSGRGLPSSLERVLAQRSEKVELSQKLE